MSYHIYLKDLAGSLRGCVSTTQEACSVVFDVKRILGMENHVEKLQDLLQKSIQRNQQKTMGRK